MKWTKAEIDLLTKTYNKISGDKLMKLFPDRHWVNIKQKAFVLKLTERGGLYTREGNKRTMLKNTINVDFEDITNLSYILGVIDGDGWCSKVANRNTYLIGLETIYKPFVDKFKHHLKFIGLNPAIRLRKKRNSYQLYITSKELGNWYSNVNKKKYLRENNTIWQYLEGMYDSEGHLHRGKYPMTCNTDIKLKKLLLDLLKLVGINANEHIDKIYVPIKYADIFLSNVNSVYPKKMGYL